VYIILTFKISVSLPTQNICLFRTAVHILLQLNKSISLCHGDAFVCGIGRKLIAKYN